MGDYTAKRIDDMEGFYKGLFRKARDEIGAKSFGLAVIELEPNADNHPDHDHPDQEEVYVVLRGTGQLMVDGRVGAARLGDDRADRPEHDAQDQPGRGRHAPAGDRRRARSGVRGARATRTSGAPDPLA